MESKQFSTRELVLASTLVALGFQPSNLDVSYEGENNNPVGYFIFDRTPELMEAVGQFRARTIRVEPNAYHGATRAMKSWVTEMTR